METNEKLTLEEATEFFSEFYGGEHHIPDYKPKLFGGSGYSVIHDRGGLSTYDFNQLTRLVFMAHEKCIRVELIGYSSRKIRIAIWKRNGTEGNMSRIHPTIEDALAKFRTNNK